MPSSSNNTPETPATLYQIIENWSQTSPHAVALNAPDRAPLTYQKLEQCICTVISTLNGMGIGRNDRVAVALPNGAEMAITFLAVASGATCAPLNPNYREKEFAFYLEDLKPKALILQAGIADAAREVAEAKNIPILELTPQLDAEAGVFSLNAVSDLTNSLSCAKPEDMALILHTSGTTSRPKMVPLSQHNLCTSAENIRQSLALTERDRALNVMPLFHIHGLMGVLLSSMKAGASVVCTPGFQAPHFFEWIEEFSPTWYSAVPTMHQAILSRAETNREIIKNHPLRFLRSSSASLASNVMASLEEIFQAPVIEAYGMTEASHQMTSNPLPPLKRKAGSVGLPAGPEVAIMDEMGNFLATGEIGEIVIRGGNVTQGYASNPEANAKAFTNGWFRTGDQGSFDADGYLTIRGRIKELINRGGEKIAPREIDEVLLTHPAIAQAVAFAIPHPQLGEEVGVAVVLKEGKTVTEEALQTFVSESLAEFKVPRRVVFVETIPKGATGKLQRIGLADKLGVSFLANQPEKTEFAEESSTEATSLESVIARIWAEILNLENVRITDNFYALGGQSLEAVKIVNEIEELFAVKLPLLAISNAPTVTQLATLMKQRSQQEVQLETLAQQILDVAGMEEEEIEKMLAE